MIKFNLLKRLPIIKKKKVFILKISVHVKRWANGNSWIARHMTRQQCTFLFRRAYSLQLGDSGQTSLPTLIFLIQTHTHTHTHTQISTILIYRIHIWCMHTCTYTDSLLLDKTTRAAKSTLILEYEFRNTCSLLSFGTKLNPETERFFVYRLTRWSQLMCLPSFYNVQSVIEIETEST